MPRFLFLKWTVFEFFYLSPSFVCLLLYLVLLWLGARRSIGIGKRYERFGGVFLGFPLLFLLCS